MTHPQNLAAHPSYRTLPNREMTKCTPYNYTVPNIVISPRV